MNSLFVVKVEGAANDSKCLRHLQRLSPDCFPKPFKSGITTLVYLPFHSEQDTTMQALRSCLPSYYNVSLRRLLQVCLLDTLLDWPLCHGALLWQHSGQVGLVHSRAERQLAFESLLLQ